MLRHVVALLASAISANAVFLVGSTVRHGEISVPSANVLLVNVPLYVALIGVIFIPLFVRFRWRHPWQFIVAGFVASLGPAYETWWWIKKLAIQHSELEVPVSLLVEYPIAGVVAGCVFWVVQKNGTPKAPNAA